LSHRKPLAIDLFCGLGGWTEGFLSEGWDVVGFDIERHQYAVTESHFGGLPKTRISRYPAQLVLQDVLTLDGRQFRHADCIVASPPCQEFSYLAMPWSRAKQIAAALRGERQEDKPIPFPEGYTGSRTVEQLRALFDACFRIQREASIAAGRHIPMVVENVKGAQPWVGPAKAHFGSFYFWGDVGMVGNQVVAGGLRFGETVKAVRRRGMKWNPDGTNHPQGSWFAVADSKERGANGVKVGGLNWSRYGEPDYKPQAFNVVAAQQYREEQGTKQGGSGDAWFDSGLCKKSSRSDSRKAASAQIARIPFPLASYIARQFSPALPA